jgi:branched-chain amino acid transport system substrate-binding protein
MTDEQPGRPLPVTRRQLVQGMGAATFGGVVAGGAAGFFGGRSSTSDAATTAKGQPVTVGALIPVTGASAGDGQEMLRGLRLGVNEINTNGGVGGRPLQIELLDAKDQPPDVMVAAMRKFAADGVAAVFSPFLTYTNVELAVIGPAKIPVFHVNTFQGNVDYAVNHHFANIFEGCPSEVWYAHGFTTVLNSLIAAGKFKPRNKTVSIVTSNDAYSSSIAQTLRKDLTGAGWRIVQYDTYTVPQADWGGVLTRVRSHNPDLVFQSDYFAGDEASFIKQFAQAPTRSLVYQQYAPSVPEYRQLSGTASNGVLWATTTGTILGDDIGQRYQQAYVAAYHQQPGLSNSGNQYDLVRLWAQAAALAPDPYAYDRVGDNVRNMVFRGVNGTYKMGPTAQTCMPYPAYTDDPSLGTPLLTYQIQNGKQVIISPEPYSTGAYQTQPWLA